MSFWTDERMDELRKLRADKESYPAIAARFGVSQNAVIGKVHRLGLLTDAKPRTSRPKNRGEKSAPPVVAKEEAKVSVAPISPAPSEEAAISANAFDDLAAIFAMLAPGKDIALPVSERVTVFELRDNTCRWPINDGDPFLFCGASGASLAAGRPYCAEHAAAAKSRGFSLAERQQYIAEKKRKAMERTRHVG